jgi:hypothetical protein
MSYYALTLGGGGGSGTVTSVSWTGGIVSIATATSTPAFTIAGTSGGIVYFDSATTWASSGVLTNNALIKGGGAGGAPSSVTTGTGVLTALGVNTGSAGAFVVNGGDLGTPSAGVVTNLTGTASININGTVGATTANTGTFSSTVHKGATSGTVTITAPAVAGTQSYTLPSAVPAANGYALTSTTAGVMSWASVSGGSAATPSALGTVYGSTSTSNANCAVGYQATNSYSTGQNITAVGYQALFSATTASYNTVIGYQAGYATTGGGNTLIGSKSGYGGGANLTTGTNCIYIGPDINASAAGVNTEFVIGYSATIGKGATTFYVNPNGGASYQGNNSASWSVTSDQRLKKNIVDNDVGLDAIKNVRVRNFEYRLPDEVEPGLKPSDAIAKTGIQLGVIAQELQAVLPDCVRQESTGVMSVDSDNLTWHMINAIKQLSAALDAANERIAALEAK